MVAPLLSRGKKERWGGFGRHGEGLVAKGSASVPFIPLLHVPNLVDGASETFFWGRRHLFVSSTGR